MNNRSWTAFNNKENFFPFNSLVLKGEIYGVPIVISGGQYESECSAVINNIVNRP